MHEHRAEPVVVEVHVDELMVDLGVWAAYDDAQNQLSARYEALDLPTVTYRPGEPEPPAPPPATEEQERAVAAIAELEDRLEEQRRADWTAYGQAIKAAIDSAAAGEGLTVPVVVVVDVDTFRPLEQDRGMSDTLAERLLSEAIDATPRPGDDRAPLDRLAG